MSAFVNRGSICQQNVQAKSHRQKYNTPLSAATQAEQRKIAKYKGISAAHHAQFVPFAIETYGGIGKSTQRFIRKIATFAHDNQFILSKREIIERIQQEIAITLQRGNARAEFMYHNSYCPKFIKSN